MPLQPAEYLACKSCACGPYGAGDDDPRPQRHPMLLIAAQYRVLAERVRQTEESLAETDF